MSLADDINALQADLGLSGRGLARELGVNESTVRRWKAGSNPTDSSVRDRIALARKLATTRDKDVKLNTVDGGRGNPKAGRKRTITGRQLNLRDGAAQRAARKALTGGASAAQRSLADDTRDDWYRAYLRGDESEGSEYDIAAGGVSVV